jgi:hypothetical protein
MKNWIGLLLIGLASCGVFQKQPKDEKKPVWRAEGMAQHLQGLAGQQALYVAFDSLYYLQNLLEAGVQFDLATLANKLTSFRDTYEPGQFNNYGSAEIVSGRPKLETSRQLILVDRAELFLSAEDYMSLLLYSWEKLEKGGTLLLIRPKPSALPRGTTPAAEPGEGRSAGQISMQKLTVDSTLSPFVYMQMIQK